MDLAQIKILYEQAEPTLTAEQCKLIIGLLIPLCERLEEQVCLQAQQIALQSEQIRLQAEEMVPTILGLKLSSGSLDNFRKSAAAQLSGFMEALKQTITQAGAAFFDETGMKVAKQRLWSHIAATKLHSLFSLHPKRGGEVHEYIGILPGFTGIAHHDALPAYNRFEQATHSLCCAHILRELTFAVERNGQAEWAEPMIRLLLSIKSSVARSPTRTVDLRWQIG